MGAITDPRKAALVMTLGDAGYPGTQIAKMVDLPQATAYDILARHGRWGEVAERSVFVRLRSEQKTALEATSRMLAAKCLLQVEKTLDKTSAYQAAGIYGLLRTHERLDAGEPTEIHAHTHEVPALDRLADRLSQRLVAPADSTQGRKIVDITEG